MKREFDFNDIRPFYDHEVKFALKEIIEDPRFMQLVNYLWPEMRKEEILSKAAQVNTCLQFQLEFMQGAINKILEKSANGLSTDGFEKLEKTKSYLFVANHRDIFLDAAILQIVLVSNGHATSEISYGSNLRQDGFINLFLKLNRMFTVQREGSTREKYETAQKLSAYIQHTLFDNKTSVWIAQRNGRTKDGLDITQPGLLKMLSMNASKSIQEHFADLNIVPLCISYEYEPCDFLKTEELYHSMKADGYVKSEGEDLKSIVTGITQQKGKIHLSAGSIFDAQRIQENFQGLNDQDFIKKIAAEIDLEIHAAQQLYPANAIAADLMEGSEKRSSTYSVSEKATFTAYMQHGLSKIKGEPELLQEIFLKMYAAPQFLKEEAFSIH